MSSSGSFSISPSSFFFPVTKSVRSWPLSSILNKHLGDYPTPANLSYFWSFGSLAGICLGVQLVTGIILAMHYVANADLAFASVEHIMRDVQGGWLIRYLHANGASFFFIAVYVHIARAVFYRSYVSNGFAWLSGVLIFFLLMATAFIGYVLPWGQMSFWGATVITNLFSAIPGVGIELVFWLWGGFSVSNATLNRFFSLHYLLPIILAAIALLHLFFLHGSGSSNPLGVNHSDKLPFFPYFVLKDVIGLFVFGFIYLFFVFYFPNTLGHFDNYIEANPFITPMHIVPEWYFLPFYAILRSIPNKLGGVVCMGIAIAVLAVLPLIDATRLLTSPRFSYFANNVFWLFALATLLLGWLGGMPVEFPFVIAGQLSTLVYFSFFGFLLPAIVALEFYTLSIKLPFRE